VKTELFPKDFVLELKTKKLGHSPSFLTITYTTLYAKRFRGYRILMIDVAAEFCFWIEKWWNGSSISHIGLAETLEVPNAILDENSLSFPMVH
jgi:hypothetical protein